MTFLGNFFNFKKTFVTVHLFFVQCTDNIIVNITDLFNFIKASFLDLHLFLYSTQITFQLAYRFFNSTFVELKIIYLFITVYL